MSFVVILFLGGFLLITVFSISLFWNFKKIGKIVSLLQIATFIFGIFLLLTGLLLLDSVYALKQVGSDNYTKLGPYGDYIGGMLNPLIALFAVIAAGFAFYAQYQANKQVQDQFKSQQFESQFFERIKFLKEELNSIYLPLSSGKEITGKRVFYELDKEIKLIYESVNISFPNFSSKEKLKLTYETFFKGKRYLSNNITLISNRYITNTIDVNNYLNSLSLYTLLSPNGRFNSFIYNIFISKYNTTIKHEPFKGMQTKVSIILRQIFSLVKYVATFKDLTYEQKRSYLRIVRSLLEKTVKLTTQFQFKLTTCFG